VITSELDCSAVASWLADNGYKGGFEIPEEYCY